MAVKLERFRFRLERCLASGSLALTAVADVVEVVVVTPPWEEDSEDVDEEGEGVARSVVVAVAFAELFGDLLKEGKMEQNQ